MNIKIRVRIRLCIIRKSIENMELKI